jgi:hypothetical protein
MKRGLVVVLCGIAAATLPAQSPDAYQDAYPQAYAAWLKSSAGLERDAAKAGEMLAVRTDAAAADAVKLHNARRALFEAQRAEVAGASSVFAAIQMPAEVQSSKIAAQFFSSQDAMLANNISTFAGDPDEGIQKLKQALEKERAALAGLKSAVEARETAANGAKLANDAAERARQSLDERTKTITASLDQAAGDAGRMAEAWPNYYRSLASGARGFGASGAEIGTSEVRGNGGTGGANGAAQVATVRPAATAAGSPAAVVAPAQGAPSGATAPGSGSASNTTAAGRPPVPLARYTGAWGFNPSVSTFQGNQPTMFDLIVKIEGEQNDILSGILSAKFIVSTGSDDAVKFNFSGTLQATRNQTFPVKTPEGAMGTIELIPGSAFNLLEVKFHYEGAPWKVSSADVVLLKK